MIGMTDLCIVCMVSESGVVGYSDLDMFQISLLAFLDRRASISIAAAYSIRGRKGRVQRMKRPSDIMKKAIENIDLIFGGFEHYNGCKAYKNFPVVNSL